MKYNWIDFWIGVCICGLAAWTILNFWPEPVMPPQPVQCKPVVIHYDIFDKLR
jgi:hypothetical protein